MQLPYRMKRHAVSNSSIAGPHAEAMSRTSADSAADPPASFDDWLDGRLRTLYQTVVNEPLPPEILDLLNEVDKSK
jgi:Anti-sigma factor NepR